ncbi:hypothetical protein ACF1CG_09535 [Streptomyces sp. NPDC014773]|uniref:hypothetical protein n=1 Tax=Streptomyces sp. NPDC014773 TaxID=3364908 RepID=UPI0037028F51
MGDGVVGAIRGLFRGRGERGSGPGAGDEGGRARGEADDRARGDGDGRARGGRDDRARGDADGLARVDAEITAFGEALAAHPFVPDHGAHGPDVLADYQRALDAYERAKRDFAGDRTPRDTADVLRALDAGRHALACVDAAVEGRPRPHRLPLCFFDPRHGRAAEEVRWAPAGGTARTVAVCAADAVRLAEGRPPIESGLREPEPEAVPRARRRTAPASGPLPAAPGGVDVGADADAYAARPGRTGPRQWREGRGNAGVALFRTGPDGPAVLVVHLDRADGSWVELTEPPVDGPDRQPLTHASALTRAVVPVPSGGGEAVRLQLHTRKGWRVWLHPPEEVPHLDDELASTGSYVLRHFGGREPLRVTQHAGSAFTLHALRPDHRAGELLCEGTGAFTAGAVLPKKPGLLYVRSRGTWTLTPTGEPKRP